MQTGRERGANPKAAGKKTEDPSPTGSAEKRTPPNGSSGQPREPKGRQAAKNARSTFSDNVENIRLEEPKEVDFSNQTDEELQRFLDQSKVDFFQ
jgi:hypothetical protein